MVSLRSKLGVALLAFAWMCAMAAVAAGPATAQPFNCLPTCSSQDGRFMTIASGSGLITLSQPTLDLEIAVPAGVTSFTVGIFDGDARGVDGSSVAHWDTGVPATFSYTLYADPNRDRTGSTVVDLQGSPSVLSTSTPDNAWIDFTVNSTPAAAAPSGNQFYFLRVQLVSVGVTITNAFKVRTSGAQVGGSSLFPSPEPFGYIANLAGNADAAIIYPSFPATTPTRYDGTFSFFFDVPVTPQEISLWDGDFDRGKFDGTDGDTDDLDTPNAPFRPSWATVDTVSEGVALGLAPSTGNPPDDRTGAGSGIYLLKPPSVRYDLILPDGQIFGNENPSGNQEWEQFRISTEPYDPSQMDHSTFSLPAGIYELRAQGVDMQNLNFLLLPGRALCVDEFGVPCIPLRPFLIGDTVFSDANGDGVQDPGEPGIANVIVELLDYTGTIIATAITDADGHYSFEVEAGGYTARISLDNFNSEIGGVLVGFNNTTPEECFADVTDGNVDNCDFGYQGRGSIGNRLWHDANGNGVQDAGEPGLNGVMVELVDENGDVIDIQTTEVDGNYQFLDVAAGTYTVRVDMYTLPNGATPTYDLDGVATPHEAVVTLGSSEHRTDVDFGYVGDATIGDRVWNDANGDGVQDAGEAGINGVTVYLYDLNLEEVVATTVTSGDGNYSFPSIFESLYIVQVDAGTLPAGYTETYDFDGIGTPHEAEVELFSGDVRNDVDFGYRDANAATGSIGDRVWNDADGDGVQGAGEAGLNGVTVELLDAGNNVVATTATAGDGNYTFSDLAAGSYTVRVVAATLPAGVAPTFDADGTGTPHTAAVSLASGASVDTVDFGYRGTASVGDRVWYDANGDGAQDAGEAGINGVTVELLDGASNVIATAATAGDGNYTFSFLMGGSYSVRVVAATLPPGVAQTYDLDGAGTPHVASFTLLGGQNREDADFGYRGTGSLGDRLWLDTNGDGVQDPGEAGINGATVQLFDAGNNLIATTTTAGDGIYGFSDLGAGTYTVRIVPSTLPAGVEATYDLDGVATLNEATFTLGAGASRDDVDFGYRGTASVGDRVWHDANGDGVQDAGEAGINGVTVELLDSTSTVIATAATSGDGDYTFSYLLGGSYSVRVVAATLPAGLAPAYDLDGIGTAHVASFTLNAGQSRTDVDFGYRGTASIGDRVWNDANGDGTQDAGEAGSNGVTVELLDGANNVVATTVTAGDGNYTFSNLDAGTYTVRVTAPAGTASTYDVDGVGTPNVAVVTLAAGDSRTDVDFGYRGTASIGDRVWNDANGDGAQDAGEAGINGVTVELLDSANNVVATTTTAGDGNYTFSNLSAGTYTVRVTAPAGTASTYDVDGVGTPNVATASLAAGDSRTDVDFGYRGTASIGDRVWNDANGDGAQDAGEAGINGVTVELLDGANNVIATTVTAGDGNYTFSNLDAGTYTVRVTAPAGTAPTYDLDGIATAHTASFSLAAGASRDDVDFGYRATASIGDRIWSDLDGDGVQEAGEAGINGVTVELLDAASNVIATTTTSGDGDYTLSGLAPGTYTVRVASATVPDGFEPTHDLDGTATAHTAAVTLGSTSRTDVDFGYRPDGDCVVKADLQPELGAALGSHDFWLPGIAEDFIFTPAPGGFSIDPDGTAYLTGTIRSAANPGNAFTVEVELSGFTTTPPAGSPKKEFAASAYAENGGPIDPAGWWYYTGLTGTLTGTGNYAGAVIEIVRTGPAFQVGFGANNKNGNYGFSGWFNWTVTQQPASGNLQATGQGDINSDLVECPPATASVGDRVWTDSNGDGVQDAGEAGINGVTVELLDTYGNVIDTTTTSGDGNYTFANLLAGNYSVRITAPAGTVPTYDLDGTGSANVASFSLTAGEARTDVDFGYRGNLSVGDRVWSDTDGDGVQDAGEAGLNGVTVELLDSGNTVIATATTSGNGNYTFDNLTPGSYSVRVAGGSLPAGYTQTYDLDGVATAHTASFNLTASRTDVDFGYKPPVVCTPGTFKDTFTNKSFSNNEGSLDWDGAWIEDDVAGAGVNNGNVTVGTPVNGYLILNDSPDTGTQPSVARQMDLSGFASATLAVDLHIRGVESDDAAVIEVSSNGGSSYTVLETFTGLTGNHVFSRTYNLSAHLASNTRIRFRITNNYGGGDDYFKVDMVKVDASCTPAPPQTFSAGDRVWKDTDGDGVQDSGEPGIGNVTVQLLDSSNTVIATDVTDGNGIYGFTGLAAGTYTVRVVSSSLPSGYTPTYDLDGIATPHTVSGPLTENRSDVDFGYKPAPACAAGTFKDTFTNKSFSNNEGSLDWDGAWIEDDVAGAGVNNGNVTVGTPVNGYLILRDSPDTGTQPSVARQMDLSGYASATLAVDLHIRGVESDDAAVIEVSSNGGASYTVLETFTGLTGNHVFSRTYNLSAHLASNTRIRFRITNNYGGGDDYFKVNMVKVDASCTPAPQTYSAGDRVWKDTDGDGVQDSGEPGIGNVTVQLLDSSNTVVATDVTDSNGGYSFTGIAAGSYTVKVVSSTLPSGLTPSYDLDGVSSAHQATFSLTANRTDVDFGYEQQSTNPGTGTIGYWKNHSEAWPVESITLGNQTYTKSQAIALLRTSSRGDKSIDLAKQLIAAKLNVIIGNDSTCIAATITAADNWLKQYPVGSKVKGSSAAWQTGGPLHATLDNYNNGRMCAPHRG